MWDTLVDLRETRNVIAHNGGAVTHNFRASVRGTKFRIGEQRILSDKDVRAALAAVRKAGFVLLEQVTDQEH